jgi:hypothetical protein
MFILPPTYIHWTVTSQASTSSQLSFGRSEETLDEHWTLCTLRSWRVFGAGDCFSVVRDDQVTRARRGCLRHVTRWRRA